MKRLADYNITSDEARIVFGSINNYKLHLKLFEEDSVCGDSEKLDIASLLSLRGKHEEALNMINSIKDAGYREPTV